jgi:hypothetical protein
MKKLLTQLATLLIITISQSFGEIVWSQNDYPEGTPTAPMTRTGAEIFGDMSLTSANGSYTPNTNTYTLQREVRIGDYHGLGYRGTDGSYVMIDVNVDPSILDQIAEFGQDETAGAWPSLSPNAKHSIVIYSGMTYGGVRFVSTNQATITNPFSVNYDSFVLSDGATSVSTQGLNFSETEATTGAFIDKAEKLNIGLTYQNGEWTPQ